MKKEVFIAIFIGFAIGLIITFGIHTAQRSIQNRPTSTSPNLTPSPDEVLSNHAITITNPPPYHISTTDTPNISGFTTPNSLIAVITTPDEVSYGLADEQGTFNLPISLSAGENVITLHAYSPSDNAVAQAEHRIIYSTADLSLIKATSKVDQEEAETLD